ncbi:hypothetical protein D3C85_1421360 [compost metagenome]
MAVFRSHTFGTSCAFAKKAETDKTVMIIYWMYLLMANKFCVVFLTVKHKNISAYASNSLIETNARNVEMKRVNFEITQSSIYYYDVALPVFFDQFRYQSV